MMRILIRDPASVLALIGKEERGDFFLVCFALCKDFSRNDLWSPLQVENSATARRWATSICQKGGSLRWI